MSHSRLEMIGLAWPRGRLIIADVYHEMPIMLLYDDAYMGDKMRDFDV